MPLHHRCRTAPWGAPRRSLPPGWRRLAAGLALVLSAWPALAAQGSRTSLQGLSLGNALQRLEAEGLKLVWSSGVVRPDMKVKREPSGTSPREILVELLAEHGLGSRAEGAYLVVVPLPPASPGGQIRGRVVDSANALPVAGARVSIAELDREARTSEDGSYELAGVPPGSYVLEAGAEKYLGRRAEGIVVEPGGTAEVDVRLVARPIALEEIVVTPSRITLSRREPVATFDLTRRAAADLPRAGDDFVRAASLLPGTAATDLSAELNVRGGRKDELLVMLDGLELYEPYHLKDFGSALSIVSPQALESLDLTTGGFSASYGDRMSGVLDMTTVEPASALRGHLGLSAVDASAGAGGTFLAGRGGWLAAGRIGTLEQLSRIVDLEEDPDFWDALLKLDYQLSPRHSLRGRYVEAHDGLELEELDTGEPERFQTSYLSSYVWIAHQFLASPRIFAVSTASFGKVDRDRNGIQFGGDERFSVVDRRDVDLLGLEQHWNLELGDDHLLEWGFGSRSLDSSYDYANTLDLDSVLSGIRTNPAQGRTELRDLRNGRQWSVFASDRTRLGEALTLELGLRWEKNTLVDDQHLSPRLNLVYAATKRTDLRAAWGLFYQSQRSYELQVEDGVTSLAPDEQAEQRVIGLDHYFENGLSLRVEGYQRLVRNPRPRFENLFDPVSSFPEAEADRVLLAPRRAKAEGLELFLRSAPGRGRLDWWVSYALSSAEDEIAGRATKRSFDQPHLFRGHAAYRWGAFTLSGILTQRSGWPTTALLAELRPGESADTPEIVPLLGPINAERLPGYSRLDLRASRSFRLRRGELTLSVDLFNALGHANARGFEFDFAPHPDGTVEVLPSELRWPGRVPSIGILWEY